MLKYNETISRVHTG